MRAVLQRVSEASVMVDHHPVGSIRTGLMILLGVTKTDGREEVHYLSDKVLGLRVFPDDAGKMNRNIVEAGGALLVVSQFTLYGDCRRGRRPSFDDAAPPEQAQDLYNYFVERLRAGPVPVETGIFQASMEVRLVNQGPVTILLDTADWKRK
ncbi:MAG: D-aminoacyl-tRNA deacylase [Candidatus Solibacter sp.]